MIEKYLIERKDIVSKQIEKINLKIEHNSNVLEENTKKIKELEYIDDEAANIFSVKVRKEEFYKQKEASSLKEQSNSIKEQNALLKDNVKELKKELKEEESGLTEEFDIFDNIIEEDSRTKKIGNQKYRETSRNKFEILEINKMTKQLGFKITLEKIIQIIKDGFESVKAPEDAIIYKAINDEKIDENEFNTFNLNPQEEIIEACNKEGKEINLYKINLKKGDSVIGFTNIIYCNNKNKTLPVGMDFSNKVMIELTKFEKKFKKSNTFHIAKFEDENNDFSKLIIKDVIVYEEK